MSYACMPAYISDTGEYIVFCYEYEVELQYCSNSHQSCAVQDIQSVRVIICFVRKRSLAQKNVNNMNKIKS